MATPHIHQTREWATLTSLHDEFQAEEEKTHLRHLLRDPARVNLFTRSALGIYYDFTRQRIDEKIFQSLLDLAKRAELSTAIKRMYSGEKINYTEDRAVLHVALRAQADTKIFVDNEDVIPGVQTVLQKIAIFSQAVREGKFAGYSGKRFTHVVVIGIGGSSLGVQCVYDALASNAAYPRAAELRFVANVDPTNFVHVTADLNPETTLFIIASKTFTTEETMLNANLARTWVLNHFEKEEAIGNHFVAVSTSADKVKAFGIDPDNMFEFWSWVGGRYSVWSAIGMLPLSIVFGAKVTDEFRDGGRQMDDHFVEAPLDLNLPVIAGLLSLWGNNFCGLGTHAVIAYSEGLASFTNHLQQLEMESNGKYVHRDGTPVGCHTGEVYFGAPGTNSQHSFFQLLHQGTHMTQMDFMVFCRCQSISEADPMAKLLERNQKSLVTHCLSQADALACGRPIEDLPKAPASGSTEKWLKNLPNKVFQGNRPSSVMMAETLDASMLGKLLALYEHRVFVQATIWGINAFDQFGVELGKVLAKQNISAVLDDKASRAHMNPATQALLKQYHSMHLASSL